MANRWDRTLIISLVQRRPRQLSCIATTIRPWHNVCHQKRKTRVVTHGPNWKRRRQVGHRRLGVLIPMTNRIGHLIAWVYVAYYFEKNLFLYKLIISILVHVYPRLPQIVNYGMPIQKALDYTNNPMTYSSMHERVNRHYKGMVAMSERGELCTDWDCVIRHHKKMGQYHTDMINHTIKPPPKPTVVSNVWRG